MQGSVHGGDLESLSPGCSVGRKSLHEGHQTYLQMSNLLGKDAACKQRPSRTREEGQVAEKTATRSPGPAGLARATKGQGE